MWDGDGIFRPLPTLPREAPLHCPGGKPQVPLYSPPREIPPPGSSHGTAGRGEAEDVFLHQLWDG